MAWNYTLLPSPSNYYDTQVLVTSDGASATDSLTNAALLAFLPAQSPLRDVLGGTYGSAPAAAQALFNVARVRVTGASAGNARGWGFSLNIDGSGKIIMDIGHDGAVSAVDGLFEMEFKHTMIR